MGGIFWQEKKRLLGENMRGKLWEENMDEILWEEYCGRKKEILGKLGMSRVGGGIDCNHRK